MCAFQNLYSEFESLVIVGRDPDTLIDLVERYHQQCVTSMYQMANLRATTHAEIELKISMWQDAVDYGLGTRRAGGAPQIH